MTDVFIVRRWGFDMPGVPRVNDNLGRELFGVFSYDDGPDEPAYCNYTGTWSDCRITARDWNKRLARGEQVIVSPVIRVY